MRLRVSRAAVAAAMLLTVAAGLAMVLPREADGVDQPGIVLRPVNAGAQIVGDGGVPCRVDRDASYRIVAPPAASRAGTYLYVKPSVLTKCDGNAEPPAFYLDLAKSMERGYLVQAREQYFEETKPPKEGQPYLKLKPIDRLLPEGSSTQATKAVSALWSRYIGEPIKEVRYEWKPTSGQSSQSQGSALSINVPTGWKSGDLVVSVDRDTTLTWRVVMPSSGPTSNVGARGPEAADRPSSTRSDWTWLEWAMLIVVVLLVVVCGSLVWRCLTLQSRLRSVLERERALRQSSNAGASRRPVDGPLTIEDLADRIRVGFEDVQQGITGLREATRTQGEDLRRFRDQVQRGRPFEPSPEQRAYTPEPSPQRTSEAQRGARRSGGQDAPSMADLHAAGLRVLDLIEPEGRGAAAASVSGLRDWLTANLPAIQAHPVGGLNHDRWRIAVLTMDDKHGVAIPALDLTIGPDEVTKWYGGSGYDGTQVLGRANVRALARAERSPGGDGWVPVDKGVIHFL